MVKKPYFYASNTMVMQFKINVKRVMMERGIKPTPYFLYRSGIAKTTARQLIHGNPKSIKFEVLLELCSALNCTPKELLEVELPPTANPENYETHVLYDWLQKVPVFPFIEAQNFTPDQMKKLNEAVVQIMKEG